MAFWRIDPPLVVQRLPIPLRIVCGPYSVRPSGRQWPALRDSATDRLGQCWRADVGYLPVSPEGGSTELVKRPKPSATARVAWPFLWRANLAKSLGLKMAQPRR